jgi:hypothetical protein
VAGIGAKIETIGGDRRKHRPTTHVFSRICAVETGASVRRISAVRPEGQTAAGKATTCSIANRIPIFADGVIVMRRRATAPAFPKRG